MQYLDRLRGLGVGEAYLQLEGDAWIMLTAQIPLSTDSLLAEKHRYLDEDTIRRISHRRYASLARRRATTVPFMVLLGILSVINIYLFLLPMAHRM